MLIKRRDLLLSGGAILGGAAFGLFIARDFAEAHEYDVGQLKVEHPWLRAPAEGQTKAYFFAFIHNNGDTSDKLVGVKSANFGKAEIYADATHAASGGLVLPAKTKTVLAPDGAHVVLSDFKKHLEVGWGLEMTLVFEKAGEVVIDASIDAPDAKHAHDAEAMERWEKAQGKDTSGPAKAPEGHDHHHHMDHDKKNMDHDMKHMDHDMKD